MSFEVFRNTGASPSEAQQTRKRGSQWLVFAFRSALLSRASLGGWVNSREKVMENLDSPQAAVGIPETISKGCKCRPLRGLAGGCGAGGPDNYMNHAVIQLLD
ncbi:hypothetical protein AAFF_G00274750 [Aldrovandia affinis]|uniref:Uncharacterized protein n=1 Tax=Aldrovandia affinis TaxID=143900 RepID=A0AAD7SS39_9TELE|nr:hypothetical protein AAFF_G00274750 [Aldrovandia affinis]